ncbi:malonate decarboxylase subunit epsilon [Cystobacter fuscus]|uniref:ACP S-malonyltransferase n=1 Tax=Cystobacter fuscus TaxID=43 RepID=UPI002B2DBB2D|nr:malonate decarboxylase subunit epsilon [Cystobacter fuscus]
MSLGILCPGQGAQHPAMLEPLSMHPEARAVLDAASEVLGASPWTLMKGPAEALYVNALAQPLLCAVQLATWTALCSRLPTPRVFAGYSVGELAAHGCAGALDAGELFTLAQARARAMDDAGPTDSGMRAVRGLCRERLEQLLEPHAVHLALVNGPGRFVVGGREEDLRRLEPELSAQGGSVTVLPVHVASHTPLLAPAARAFGEHLAHSGLRAPVTPVLAGIDGTPVSTRERALTTLTRQVAEPVDWAACMAGLAEEGCTVLLELGPGADLSRMVRDTLPSLFVRSVSEFKTLEGVCSWVLRQLE